MKGPTALRATGRPQSGRPPAWSAAARPLIMTSTRRSPPWATHDRDFDRVPTPPFHPAEGADLAPPASREEPRDHAVEAAALDGDGVGLNALAAAPRAGWQVASSAARSAAPKRPRRDDRIASVRRARRKRRGSHALPLTNPARTTGRAVFHDAAGHLHAHELDETPLQDIPWSLWRRAPVRSEADRAGR